MAALRRISMLSARYNFRIQAKYYPGSENIVADAVSRLHEPRGFERFKMQCAYIHLQMAFQSMSTQHPELIPERKVMYD